MNCNNYQKVVHAALLYRGKILLSQRLKNGYHKGYWQDVGGKMENNEIPVNSVIRETLEETGLDLDWTCFDFIDCFIYTKRKIKTFLFKVDLWKDIIFDIKNTEPKKQGDWKWFTINEALELKLLPSVKYYLQSLKNEIKSK